MKKIPLLLCAAMLSLVSFSQKRTDIHPHNDSSALHTVYTCPMHPDMTSSAPGKCSKCHMDLIASSKERMKAEVTGTYVCPMHAEIRSEHAGICAKCRSKLVVNRTGAKGALSTYTCSMHNDVVGGQGGKCPICGKALAEEKRN